MLGFEVCTIGNNRIWCKCVARHVHTRQQFHSIRIVREWVQINYGPSSNRLTIALMQEDSQEQFNSGIVITRAPVFICSL